MTGPRAGALALATVAATGLVLLVLAVWGVARLDADLRLATDPYRDEQRDLKVFDHRCPRVGFDMRRT
jgi:hypothetical protein